MLTRQQQIDLGFIPRAAWEVITEGYKNNMAELFLKSNTQSCQLREKQRIVEGSRTKKAISNDR